MLSLVLLDEKAARSIALQRGLAVTGLLGLLDRAATLGIIEIAPTLRRLNKTNFHINPRLLKKVLEKHYP
jgi:predicted nucleic acid-binding protein